MPGHFEKHGIQFLYPENWQLTDETPADDDTWPRVVSVQSPTSAFWTLHIYEGDVNLPELVREVVQAIREDYAELEAVERLDCDDGADYGYDLDFYYLDLLITAQVRGALQPGKALVWIAQGENRDFDSSELVFRAITMSLLGLVPPPAT
jgi:hypothetical protein